jgi:hypothetical protein
MTSAGHRPTPSTCTLGSDAGGALRGHPRSDRTLHLEADLEMRDAVRLLGASEQRVEEIDGVLGCSVESAGRCEC